VAMFLGLDTPAAWNPLAGSLDTLWVSVPLYVGGLFLLCMFCHGELARRRPAAAHLTRFQLMIGIGGALGGLLVGVLAPMTLTWYWELPAALVIVAVGVVANRSWPVRAVGAIATAGTLFLSVDYARSMREDMIEMHRNFYGSVRVAEAAASPEVKSRRLVNGSITHGMQLMHADWSATPTLYYVETSGIGRVLRRLEAGAPQTPRHVGVVGLGVGTLAAYGRAGDAYRFYEIDPSVVDIARRQFTFLAESRATIETILGDARLSLAQERDQNFDVLAIDAFAGDAIPVHLLTREAGLLYRRHVRDGGVIAIHVSNRYLDLSGVCRQLADALGWRAWLIQDEPRRNAEAIGSASEWVLLTADTTLLDDLRARGIGRELPAEQALRPWTDEFNSLLPILKVSGPRKLSAEGPR
jgi:hypothetical protein